MAEINKILKTGDISKATVDEIVKIVGHDGEIEILEAEMNVVVDKKQYAVRIPTKFAQEAHIKKTDKFIFKLIPPQEEGGEFGIQAELKRDG
jgi:hypothetical protein